MQFLRTLFWVVLSVFLAIMAVNNWTDVTLNLWGSLQADIKLPLLLVLALLAGFLPTFLWLRARIWSLKRRVQTLEMGTPVPAAPPVPPAEPAAQ